MQKAHIYEAILLVNRGVDEAVRGLERLKPSEGLTARYLVLRWRTSPLRGPPRAAQFLFLQHHPALGAAGLRSL